jgi:hypothetical protein
MAVIAESDRVPMLTWWLACVTYRVESERVKEHSRATTPCCVCSDCAHQIAPLRMLILFNVESPLSYAFLPVFLFVVILQRAYPSLLPIDASAWHTCPRSINTISFLNRSSLHQLPTLVYHTHAHPAFRLCLCYHCPISPTLFNSLTSPTATLYHEGAPACRSLRRCCVCSQPIGRSQW